MENNYSNTLFVLKSDILNIHLTNLIQRIDDSIDSLNDTVSDTQKGEKFMVLKFHKIYLSM